MRTYRGTLTPGDRNHPSFYQCSRCGITKPYLGGRKKPTRCLDCRRMPEYQVRRAS